MCTIYMLFLPKNVTWMIKLMLLIYLEFKWIVWLGRKVFIRKMIFIHARLLIGQIHCHNYIYVRCPELPIEKKTHIIPGKFYLVDFIWMARFFSFFSGLYSKYLVSRLNIEHCYVHKIITHLYNLRFDAVLFVLHKPNHWIYNKKSAKKSHTPNLHKYRHVNGKAKTHVITSAIHEKGKREKRKEREREEFSHLKWMYYKQCYLKWETAYRKKLMSNHCNKCPHRQTILLKNVHSVQIMVQIHSFSCKFMVYISELHRP